MRTNLVDSFIDDIFDYYIDWEGEGEYDARIDFEERETLKKVVDQKLVSLNQRIQNVKKDKCYED